MAREKKKTQSEENNAQTGIPSGHALALYAASIDLNGLARLADTCGVAVVALEAIWDGVTVGFSPVAPSLQELPACVLGFVATSAAGAHEVELMRKAWARQFNREAPDALTVALPLDDVAVLGWIARRLVDAQRQMAERNTALMRDMYVIRSEHEAVQEAFQRLENYAYASSMLTRQLALCLEPHESAVKVGKGRTGEVRQLLPISSSGLCDVAIHLTQVSKECTRPAGYFAPDA
jgi:hypothetical protein